MIDECVERIEGILGEHPGLKEHLSEIQPSAVEYILKQLDTIDSLEQSILNFGERLRLVRVRMAEAEALSDEIREELERNLRLLGYHPED